MSNDNPHRPVLIVIAGPNGSGKPLLHRVSCVMNGWKMLCISIRI